MVSVIHNFPKEDVKELLFSIHKWLKKDGKILIYTTIHNKSEEGYYEKEDYSGKIVRFRKKFTENLHRLPYKGAYMTRRCDNQG